MRQVASLRGNDQTHSAGPAKLPIDHIDMTRFRSFGRQMSVTMLPLFVTGALLEEAAGLFSAVDLAE